MELLHTPEIPAVKMVREDLDKLMADKAFLASHPDFEQTVETLSHEFKDGAISEGEALSLIPATTEALDIIAA